MRFCLDGRAPVEEDFDHPAAGSDVESDAGAGADADADAAVDVADLLDAPVDDDDAIPVQTADAGLRGLKNCAAFWGLSEEWISDYVRDGKGEHRVPYISLPLRPYQLEAIYRIITCSSDNGTFGTVLADTMGLGKTLQSSAAAVTICYAVYAWKDVRDNEVRKGRLHLTKEQRAQLMSSGDSGAECPSGTYRLGFACPCVPHLPTFRLCSQGFLPLGPTFILAPPNLLGQWAAELSRYLTDEPLPGSPSASVEVRRLQRSGRQAELPHVTNFSNYKAAVGDVAILNGWAYVKPSLNGAHPRLAAKGEWRDNRVIFLIPASSALDGIMSVNIKVQVAAATSLDSDDDAEDTRDASFPVVPGCIIFDEFHKFKGFDTMPYKFIRGLTRRSRNTVFLIGVSATPLLKGPQDLYTFLHASRPLVSKDWMRKGRPGSELEDGKAALEEWEQKTRDSVKRQMQRAREGTDPDEDDAKLVEDCHRLSADFFSKHLSVIRRTLGTTYGTQPIMALPDMRIVDMECPTTDADLEDLVQALSAEVRSIMRTEMDMMRDEPRGPVGGQGAATSRQPTIGDVSRRLEKTIEYRRLLYCAGFPGMAQFFGAEGPVGPVGPVAPPRPKRTFAYEEFQSTPYDRIRDSPIYGEIIDQVWRGSGKMAALLELIGEMMHDDEIHKGLAPYGGVVRPLPKKMLVLTMTRPIAFFTAAYLSDKAPCPVSLLSDASDMADALRPFQRPSSVFDPADDDPDDPRVLVATLPRGGIGHNLQRVSWVVLMEPSYSVQLEEQGFGRAHRPFQLATTHLYRLVCPTNGAEKVRIARRDARQIVMSPEELFTSTPPASRHRVVKID